MANLIEKIDKLKLPILATTDTVVYPHLPMRVESEEELFSRTIAKASDSEQKLLFVVLKKQGDASDTEEQCYTVGTVCRLTRVIREEGDSLVTAFLEGVCRATLDYTREVDSVAMAYVTAKKIELDGAPDTACVALMRELRAGFQRIALLSHMRMEALLKAIKQEEDPGLLADLVASSSLENPEDRQRILENFHPVQRMRQLLILLRKEEYIRMEEHKIEQEVRERIDLGQREYYLQEKMRVIREELDEIGTTLSGDSDIDAFFEKIKQLPASDSIKEKLTRETKKLTKIPFHAAEYTVLRAYLDICLSLPYETYTEDRADVAIAREILERDHAGLEKVKKRVLEFLAVKQLNPTLGNQILCLVGAPGTGKSSIATSIAEAMNRKFVRVSLGGVRDEAEIRGHRKTYVGSMPGRIVNALIEAGTSNPLVLLDEIDKLSNDMHGDPSAALLEVLDGDQNRTFRDHYVEFPIDLSKCVFLATANTLSTIPKPLRDRMEIIELPIYTMDEKRAIGEKHLLPKQLRRHGLPQRMLKLATDAWDELICYYTKEAGVRQLERNLASLCRKVAMVHLETGRRSFTLHAKDLKKYLEERIYLPETVGKSDEIGVVNGLAYTELGGVLLKVEVAAMPGTGKVELTGSLGDVMKESAKTAISVMRGAAEQYGFGCDFWKEKDLHIHFPEGAVPKDGPSAGVTVATALCSELSGRPVRHTVAMTGEISLRGRVLPIGGVKEKLTAAFRAGARTICLPAENEKDLHELEPQVREGLEVVLCRTIHDVLRVALV